MSKTTKTNQWLALAYAGIIGPLVFALATVIAERLRSGYSPISQPISDLGIGTRPWILNCALVLCGLSAVSLSFALRHLLPRMPHRKSATILLSLFGICFAMAGIFPEPGPGSPVSVHGIMHFLFGFMIGMTTLTIALFLFSAGFRKLPGWAGYARYTLATASIMVVLVPSTFVFFNPSSPLESVGIGGLMERLLFANFLLWFVTVSWRLVRLKR